MSRGIGKLQHYLLKILLEKKQLLRPRDLIVSLPLEATKTRSKGVRHNVYVALRGLVSKELVAKEGHYYAITRRGRNELLYTLLYYPASPNLNEILNLGYSQREISTWAKGRKLLHYRGIVR